MKMGSFLMRQQGMFHFKLKLDFSGEWRAEEWGRGRGRGGKSKRIHCSSMMAKLVDLEHCKSDI